MGVPGPLDAARRTVAVAPNLGWVDVPAQTELSRRLHGLPVFLENDVRCGALAEYTLGAGAGAASMLALFVGTGIGGGLVQGGRVFHGAHGIAGEIGHMVIRAGGPRCPCGRRGCLEALAARGAIARYVVKQVQRGRSTALTHLVKGDLRGMTSGKLAKALRADDAVARKAVRRSARYAGLAIGSLVNVLDPDVVVIGGGVVEAIGEPYAEWVRAAADGQILAAAARGVRIELSRLGDDAGLLGAALTAFGDLATMPPQAAPPPPDPVAGELDAAAPPVPEV
jgi:glucokinase